MSPCPSTRASERVLRAQHLTSWVSTGHCSHSTDCVFDVLDCLWKSRSSLASGGASRGPQHIRSSGTPFNTAPRTPIQPHVRQYHPTLSHSSLSHSSPPLSLYVYGRLSPSPHDAHPPVSFPSHRVAVTPPPPQPIGIIALLLLRTKLVSLSRATNLTQVQTKTTHPRNGDFGWWFGIAAALPKVRGTYNYMYFDIETIFDHYATNWRDVMLPFTPSPLYRWRVSCEFCL